MTLFCHTPPSLPQYDSESAKRQAQLDQAKQDYVWDQTKENLTGIPMAQSLPLRNYFSLKWLIKVLEIGLSVFNNSNAVLPVGTKPDIKPKKQADCIWANLLNIACLLLTMLARFVCKILATFFSKQPQQSSLREDRDFVVAFAKAVLSPIVSKQKVLRNLSVLYDDFSPYLAKLNADLNGFKYLFKTIPLPITADTLFDDAAFARFRLAGPNPMILEKVAKIPADFLITKEDYQTVMAGDTLAQAVAENRLYVADYRGLSALAKAPGSKLNGTITTQVCTPIALFALSPDRLSFLPVAIQIEQNIYYPASDVNHPQYWEWQTAKALVQNADANYHELLVHLARTHLLTEAFAIATPRCLAENHPLFVLLNPHFEGSLFINEAAREKLVNQGGSVDNVFGANIAAVQEAAKQDRLGYNFYDAMLPTDLKRRGVDDPQLLPDYPYRDDGLLIWAAIHRWVSNYCAIYYADDAVVVADSELRGWCDELINDGLVKGFTQITSKAQLADVLTMIIYTASAQHAAVNFPQSSVMAYLPAFPGSLAGKNPPAANSGDAWFATFPPLEVGQTQVDLFYLLGSIYYGKLGEYRKNRFPYCSVICDQRAKQALAQFKKELKQIEYRIDRHNQIRKPYTFLLPSNIPASTNI